jgi:hypothetical protein
MHITLHLGAHRTASTVFQNYLRENAKDLKRHGIGVWGPLRTRDGLLRGVIPLPGTSETPVEQFRHARGRIRLNLKQAEAKGLEHLVVSDENMIGAPRRNLRDSCLYGSIGERMARYDQAFDGRITRVMLSIRSQDSFWSSVAAFAVGRGHKVPRPADLDRLVNSRRSWRDVIADLACAMPEAEITVLPYEVYGGMPERKLTIMTGLATPPMAYAREWMNRAPSLPQLRQILSDRGGDLSRLPEGEGRWHPFDHAQTMELREAYADDLFWLRAGAEGMATFIEETRPEKMGQTPHQAQPTRGQTDGIEEKRRMA